jgi:cell division protein FtsB
MSLETWTSRVDHPASPRGAASRLGHNIIVSIYSGIALYCILSVLAGPIGISAYRRLEMRKVAMEANLGELERIRGELNAEINSLKSDPDRAAREARSLGYLREGETALILGEKVERSTSIEAGLVMPYAEPVTLNDSVLKEIALGASLALLAILQAPRGVIGRAESRRRP